jgi:Tol biopolymer transport system component
VIPVAGLAALALAAEILPTQAYDPRLEWRTIDTPRFRVHYHQGLEALAQRTARACERAHAALAPLFGHEPEGPVDVVLSDDTDDANGSAEVVPRNVMRLFAVPPGSLSELDDYGDWLETLVTHEYTHILHLDTVGGLPRLLDAIFGKVLAPSGLGPSWISEGLAVLHESAPGAGRDESALFDAWARALVVEKGGLPGIDVVSSQPLDWPGANLWYLLGGRFFAYLQDRFGPGALRAFAQDQGAQIWPYFLNSLAERHFGESFGELWIEFGAALQNRYRSQLLAVRSRPLTEPRRLTRRGGRISSPRFSPDGGSLVYFDRGLHERPALRRVSPEGRDLGRLALVDGNGSFALLSAGRAVVAITDAFEEFRSVDDLYLVDLASGARERLTYGERATDPDLVPGGASAVYVARLPGGEHALRRLALDGGAPETLLHRAGAQLFLPRVSPDGRRIALEIQDAGRRDVAVLEGGELRFVTDDDALDQAPCWSSDGRTLYFSSDRSGILDLYAFEIDEAAALTGPRDPAAPAAAPPEPAGERPDPPRRERLPGRLRQVTNVTTAALQPAVSPDGRTLAFLGYSAEGYDLAAIPVDPATWLEPPAVAPRWAHRPAPVAEEPPLPSRPYSVLETLGPAWWLPIVGSDAAGTSLGAVTGGADVAGRHAWGLSAGWGLRSQEASYDLAYAAGWIQPMLSLASSRLAGSAPDGRLEVQWVPLDGAITWTRSHLDRVQAVTLGWRSLLFRPEGAPPPQDPTPYRGATASEISMGVAYGSAERFTYSISAEEGGLLALRVRYASPDLGGDQRYSSARLSASQYLRLPFTRHWVLALHGSLGGSTGTLAGRQPFRLGGLSPPDVSALAAGALGGGFPNQADELRGYPVGAFEGATLVSATSELRFPLFAPLAGISTWPLFLRRMHGAVFLDAGAVFGARDGSMGRRLGGLDALRFGAGAELRFEVVLGYHLSTDLRLGYARGLGPLLAKPPRPADPLQETQVYLTVGESF